MRIKLDRTVCDGFGLCARHAPEVFDLDDWGYPTLRGDGGIPPEQETGVRRALLDCPAHAVVDLAPARPIPAGAAAGVARSVVWTRDVRTPVGSSGPDRGGEG